MFKAGGGFRGSSCAKPLVSIIVPTLNEAPNIEPLYARLSKSLDGSSFNCFEVIFVDDGSVDGTREIVKRLSARDSRVRLIERDGERGLASAILAGVSASRGRYVVVMDADLQHPPEDVPKLIKALEEGSDIAVGSRYSRGGGVEGWSKARLVISLGATVLAWLLVPETRRTRDPMSGFFAFKRESVRLPERPPPGFKVLLEILRLNPKASVRDVPYVFRERLRGESKLGYKTILEYLAHLAIASKPLKFGLVGLGGLAVNLAALWTLLRAGAPLDASLLLGFEAGLLFNFVLHDRFTFSDRKPGRSLAGRLVGYHLSSALGVGVGYLVSRSMITFLGVNPLISQVLGVATGYLINYTLSNRKVWV